MSYTYESIRCSSDSYFAGPLSMGIHLHFEIYLLKFSCLNGGYKFMGNGKRKMQWETKNTREKTFRIEFSMD